MKLKACALIIISALIVFMAWQCFTWPVVEMTGRWIDDVEDVEAELAAHVPVQRPPTSAEVFFRGAACTISLLLGGALVRTLRSRSLS